MTRDEAANLPACLAALTRFDDVFVVDSESRDGTPEIAAGLGAQVVPFRWNGAYPKKKQWCLDRLPCRYDWVLFIDADERMTATLADEIARLIAAGPRHVGYFVTGRPVFLGRRLRFGQANLKLCLHDRRRARFPDCPDLDIAAMWEVEGHYQPRLDGSAGRLTAPLWHHDEKPLYAWFERHNRYSDWEASLAESGRLPAMANHEGRRRVFAKALFARLPFRPLWVFLFGYLVCLGFLDGAAGFHYAVARAFYYWQIAVKRRALRRITQ
ncbi:MAG: glycosyltransferase [Azospirillum sp.]|nr:glycosyltransferase [Azospirillum sp.]